LQNLLNSILETAHFEGIPAVQACAVQDGHLCFSGASGGATLASIFDVASVTKMAATTLCACVLHNRGLLPLHQEVGRFFPDLALSHTGIQVRHLLAHSSGLPAWRPFFKTALCTPDRPDPTTARDLTIQAVKSTRPEHAPGSTRIYSDTGFILLGLILEKVAGASLDRLAQELVFQPAGLKHTQFLPLGHALPEAHTLPTGSTRPRQPAPGQESLFQVPDQPPHLDPGTVDDDNAYALGGVAGHAGLFSTAADLAQLGRILLEELKGGNQLAAGESLRLFVRPDHGPQGPLRGLGFDLIAPHGSSTGERWGKGPGGGFGHLGFTGCALWLDIDRKLSAALLSNRVLPGREKVQAIRALRPAFYDGLISVTEVD
jgi:CubicO group peptidase (beta-lactamase class C family)